MKTMFNVEKWNEYVKYQFVEGPALYLPQICKLLGGDAILRHFGINRDDLCKIDLNLISIILAQYQMQGEVENLQKIIYPFMDNIFAHYDDLIKGIYKNLLENKRLDANDVKEIIDAWKTLHQ